MSQYKKEFEQKLQKQLEASEKLAAVGRIAASVMHDINSPLTFVMMNLDMIEQQVENYSKTVQKPVPDSLNKAIHGAIDGGEKIRGIINDFRLFTKNKSFDKKRVNLKSIINSAVAIASSEVKYKAKLTCVIDSSLHIYANETQIAQVLLNFIINASQAMIHQDPEANFLHINAIENTNDTVTINISDNGVGIATENQDKIFDAFFSTKNEETNSGLGLYISKKIVEEHRGTIAVASKVGVGTTFSITLPTRA